MGYTHYWRRPRQLKLETFRRFVHDVGVLLHHLPLRTNGAGGFYSQRLLVVCGAWGNGAPTLSEQEVAFNGDAAEELDHETFAVERVYCPAPWETLDLNGHFFSFCKTARKPYDLAVTGSLLLLQQHFGSAVRISSDGTAQEWEPARELLSKVFGPDLAYTAWEQVWPQRSN